MNKNGEIILRARDAHKNNKRDNTGSNEKKTNTIPTAIGSNICACIIDCFFFIIFIKDEYCSVLRKVSASSPYLLLFFKDMSSSNIPINIDMAKLVIVFFYS